MKRIFIFTILILLTAICSAQLGFRLSSDSLLITKSLVIMKQESHPMNLYFKKKDNGPKKTATAVYLGLNGIISLNQFTSPPAVQKELMPAYIGTVVLTTVAYGLFLILN